MNTLKTFDRFQVGRRMSRGSCEWNPGGFPTVAGWVISGVLKPLKSIFTFLLTSQLPGGEAGAEEHRAQQLRLGLQGCHQDEGDPSLQTGKGLWLFLHRSRAGLWRTCLRFKGEKTMIYISFWASTFQSNSLWLYDVTREAKKCHFKIINNIGYSIWTTQHMSAVGQCWPSCKLGFPYSSQQT